MLHGLRKALNLLFGSCLDNVYARHARLAEGTRRAVAAWGSKLCAQEPKWYSNTVSAIVVPEGFDARDVMHYAYHRYNLSLGAGLSEVMGKVFRIGHLGDLNQLMLCSAIAGAEMAMRDVGIQVTPGAASPPPANTGAKRRRSWPPGSTFSVLWWAMPTLSMTSSRGAHPPSSIAPS